MQFQWLWKGHSGEHYSKSLKGTKDRKTLERVGRQRHRHPQHDSWLIWSHSYFVLTCISMFLKVQPYLQSNKHKVTIFTQSSSYISIRPMIITMNDQTLGGGGLLTYSHTEICCSNGSLFYKKSQNVGPIFYKSIPKHGSIFSKIFGCSPEHLKILKNGPIFWEKNP